jgi:hypothetical protein
VARWKLGTVLVGTVAGLALGAPLAFASDESEANGGHCDYDGVIVAMNDCDTNNNGGGELEELLDELRPVVDDLEPLSDEG